MIRKVLIANRGDSACRVYRTCRRLGIAAVTVHSSADRLARHVLLIGESIEIGAAPASESYLDISAIVAAAKKTGADAVHPGIGFLSETAAFAAAVEEAGLIFIGPTADTLSRFGDKMQAKREADSAEVPVIAGAERSSDDPVEIAAQVASTGFPVLLKAAAGGGGKGMRVLHDNQGVEETIASAMREANAAFGSPNLLVEQYLPHARHVEVQIAGDGNGTVLHLFDRDCSLQRRYQKVIEEAPATGLPEGLRHQIFAAACRLTARTRFRGLATVEFLVVGDKFYFLEVNPRLQVEHSVTEMITGLDLVEWQFRIATGQGLPQTQEDITVTGHAIQARLYAEDPDNGFAPATGTIHHLAMPGRPVRVDLGVSEGETVSPLYDPMIGKLAVLGDNRNAAINLLDIALSEVSILGLPTNLAFLRSLLSRPEFTEGIVDTAFIDQVVMAKSGGKSQPIPELFAIAGAIALNAYRQGPTTDPWTSSGEFTNWRLGREQEYSRRIPILVIEIDGKTTEVGFSPTAPDGTIRIKIDNQGFALRLDEKEDRQFIISTDAIIHTVSAVIDGATIYLSGTFGNTTATVSLVIERTAKDYADSDGRVLTPVMGQVTKIFVGVGDKVKAGDVLIIQESMKMELPLTAPRDGVITALSCAEGDMVERHKFVVQVSMETAEG